jgi:hypothetical protein
MPDPHATQDREAKTRPVCKRPTDKLYGGMGKYVARCYDCWQHDHPDDWPRP